MFSNIYSYLFNRLTAHQINLNKLKIASHTISAGLAKWSSWAGQVIELVLFGYFLFSQ